MPDDTQMDLGERVAALERMLGERTAERDEALAQQAATAEVLKVINSSPGDLAPVFDAMLEKALSLCEASLGLFYRFENDAIHVLAFRGTFNAPAELLYQPVPIEPNSAIGTLARGSADFIHNLDITDDDIYRAGTPSRLKLVEVTGARTALWVALRKDKRLIGVFVIYRREVRPFTEKHIALLRNFAAQAVIAMENARLITETREALEQQTATAEVLQVINASPGDLAPVFDAMLEKAMRLCEAAFGILLVRDGSYFQTAALHGVPPALAEFLSVTPREPGKHTVVGRMLDGEDFVHFEDMTKEPDTGRGILVSGRSLSWVELGRMSPSRFVRTADWSAHIGAYRQEVRPFTDKQIALLQNFAAQAVIAMENARLLTETREALEQQTATAEVLGVINSSPGDLAPVFDAILDKAHALCGAERGTLFLYDGGKMKAVVAHGYPEDVVEHLRAGVGLAPQHAPLFAGNHVHIADLRQYGNPTGRIVSGRGGVRTNLLVPLFRNGALLGMISCNRTEVRPFSDKEIALIENFAAQAVIAIENARLITETREALEQQTATAEVLGGHQFLAWRSRAGVRGNRRPPLRPCAMPPTARCSRFDGSLIHLAAHWPDCGSTRYVTRYVPPGTGSR